MNCIVFAVYALALFTIGAGVPAITRDIKVELPGTEKINRRSPKDYMDKSAELADSAIDSSEEVFPINKRSANPKDDEIMEVSENGLVFRPLFRAKEPNSIKRSQRSVDEKDKMNTAETGIVYVPLFKSKDKFETKQRVRRSSELKSEPNVVVGTPDDLQTSDDIIFKPMFRRKTRGAHHDNDDIFGSRLVFQNQYS